MFTRLTFSSAVAGVMLAGLSAGMAQSEMPPAPAASTTGVAPAERLFNNALPSLAGQVLPSPQDAAAHNPAVLKRAHLPTLAHTFNFTPEQRRLIQDALVSEQSSAKPDLAVKAGDVLPQPVDLKAIPDSIGQRIPWVQRYRYAKLGNRIVIVDPHLPVVVDVIG